MLLNDTVTLRPPYTAAEFAASEGEKGRDYLTKLLLPSRQKAGLA
jgi:hypothetical protein